MSYVFGVSTGSHRIVLRDGRVFPLPRKCFPGAETQKSLDEVTQGPGAFGGIVHGLGQLGLLTVTYGSKEASGNGIVRFPSAADARGWKEAFKSVCRQAVRVEDASSGKRLDGPILECTVEHYLRPDTLSFSFRAGSTAPVFWKLAPRVVAGSPAACPNPADLPCYPVIEGTATGATVTVASTEGTLTVPTTAGAAVRIDTTEADGRVIVAGALGDATGTWPVVEPGGSTFTITGLSGVTTTYLEHLTADWTVEEGPGGGGSPWNLVSSNGPDGGVILSEPGLSSANGGGGGVVLSGLGLTSTNGPNGGVILS